MEQHGCIKKTMCLLSWYLPADSPTVMLSVLEDRWAAFLPPGVRPDSAFAVRLELSGVVAALELAVGTSSNRSEAKKCV